MDSVKPTARTHVMHWGALVLVILFVTFLFFPDTFIHKFYLIGFGICPQRASHSFFLGGARLPGEANLRAALPWLNALAPSEPTKLPVEARMFGMFAGFLLTWAFSLLRRRGRAAAMPRPLLLFTFISMIAVMGADGINATLYDLHHAGLPVLYAYAPRLDLRFFTGWLCGLAMAGILLPVVNYCLWRDAEPRALFERVRDLIPLVLLGGALLILQELGSGLYLYPLAALAPLGILATLGALNIVLVLTLAKRERIAAHWRDALNPIAIAVCLSLLELGTLSLLRWLAFGFRELG
jgi:hypothetical protein